MNIQPEAITIRNSGKPSHNVYFISVSIIEMIMNTNTYQLRYRHKTNANIVVHMIPLKSVYHKIDKGCMYKYFFIDILRNTTNDIHFSL